MRSRLFDAITCRRRVSLSARNPSPSLLKPNVSAFQAEFMLTVAAFVLAQCGMVLPSHAFDPSYGVTQGTGRWMGLQARSGGGGGGTCVAAFTVSRDPKLQRSAVLAREPMQRQTLS